MDRETPLQIDRLCDAFEREWRAGGMPRLDEWMTRIGPQQRVALGRELCRLDAECRVGQRHPVPSLSEYVRWTGIPAETLVAGDDDASRFLRQVLTDGSTQRFDRAAESDTASQHPQSSRQDPDESGGVDADTRRSAGHLGQIAGCELRGVLGRGGSGIVYRGWQPGVDRDVAVKTLASGHLTDPETRRQFASEAKTAGRLRHPGIVTVYEAGEDGRTPYIVMELIEGPTLEEECLSGRLSFRRIAELLAEIAEAMAFAHGHDVVHRDLKPSNILIGPDGRPRIADFGLARLENPDQTVTATGLIVGTAAYMGPEQARGESRARSAAVDIYALGAILYRCLTGRPPFHAASRLEVIRQVLDVEPVRPRQLNREIPVDLETLCLRCLEKEPDQRLPSAAYLAEELRRFLDGRPIRSRPTGAMRRGWRWCRRRPLVAGMSAAALLLSLLVMIGVPILLWQQSALRVSESQRQQAAENERAERYFSRLAEARELRVARSPGWTLQVDRIVRDLAADQRDYADGTLLRSLLVDALTNTDLVEVPVFCEDLPVDTIAVSPDGRTVVMPEIRSSSDLMVHEFDVQPGDPLRGESPFTLSHRRATPWPVRTRKLRNSMRFLIPSDFEPPGYSAAAFSPDGQSLALGTRNGDLRILDLTTNPVTIAVERSFPSGADSGAVIDRELCMLQYSPDGRSLYAWHEDAHRLRRLDTRTGEVLECIESMQWSGTLIPLETSELVVNDGGLTRVLDAQSLSEVIARKDVHLMRQDGSCSSYLLDQSGEQIAICDSRTLTRGLLLAEEDGGYAGYSRIGLAADGSAVAAILWDEPRLRLWDGLSGQIVTELDAFGSASPKLGMDPIHRRVFLSSGGVGRAFQLRGPAVEVADAPGSRSTKPVMTLVAPGVQSLHAFALHPEGRELFLYEYGGGARVERWDVRRIDRATQETTAVWCFCPLRPRPNEYPRPIAQGIACSPTDDTIYVSTAMPAGILKLDGSGIEPLQNTTAPFLQSELQVANGKLAECTFPPVIGYHCTAATVSVAMFIPRALRATDESIRVTLESPSGVIEESTVARQVDSAGWYLFELGDVAIGQLHQPTQLTCRLRSNELTFAASAPSGRLAATTIHVGPMSCFPLTTGWIPNFTLGPLECLADGTLAGIVNECYVTTWEPGGETVVMTWSDWLNASPGLRGFACADDRIFAATRNANTFVMDRFGHDHLIQGAYFDAVYESFNTASAIATSRDGTLVFVGQKGGALAALDLTSGRPQPVLTGLQLDQRVRALALSPDETLLAAGDEDRVRFWKITRSEAREWFDLSLLSSRAVRQLQFSPDGTRLYVLCEGERGLRVLHLDRLERQFADTGLDRLPLRPVVASPSPWQAPQASSPVPPLAGFVLKLLLCLL